jgi:hypothetical protein
MMKQMRNYFLILTVLVAGFFPEQTRGFSPSKPASPNQVDIVLSAFATVQEKMAASQLNDYLKTIYPAFRFSVTSVVNESNLTIQMGVAEHLSVIKYVTKDIPLLPEGFLVRSLNDRNLVITSHSAKGLFNAVYSLLEKLGYGFYLSYEGTPKPKEAISFKEWEMTDFPLQAERIVFDWHNFLSGCTGWNYEDWCSWIDQSAKMRYNTIMVHAYGNNPMFSFEYNGQKKEVGFLTTSSTGRDWGAQHVNDVRRLPGGQLFTGPVFGSNAVLVPDNQRGDAATKLMARVFEHAHEMAMKINFAIDVDTWSANSKNIIESLPADCRIKLEKQDIVNPETANGYEYYKAQVQSLLKNYPQITTITVWVRGGGTLWRDIRPAQFPALWLNDWKQLIARNPDLEKIKFGTSTFAISKIVKAYQKAVREIGRADVTIAYGSWAWDFLSASSEIMPENCPLIALDYNINFDAEVTKNFLSRIGSKHKIIPVVWAQHDDHRYMGRPYTPYSNFNRLLKERNAAGFGIIHWTTRPLDLFFKSLGDQVWSKSEDKKPEATISDYCQSVFGSQQPALQDYVNHWMVKGPMFGRETTEHFFDLGKQKAGESYEPLQVTMNGISTRKGLLEQVRKSELSVLGKKMFRYNLAMEDFYFGLYQNQDKFTSAYTLLGRKSLDSAKLILQTVSPERTIEAYASASSILPVTPGEKALVISMGSRWYPDFVNLKQRAGMTDICYKFEATQHDSLAQESGAGTYFIDRDKTLWMCLGERELKCGKAGISEKAESAGLPENERTFVKMTTPFELPLVTFGKNVLQPGKYRVELKCLKNNIKSDDCQLFLKNGKSRLPVKTLAVNSGVSTRKLSAIVELQEGEKYILEIEPGTDAKRFVNFRIIPVN